MNEWMMHECMDEPMSNDVKFRHQHDHPRIQCLILILHVSKVDPKVTQVVRSMSTDFWGSHPPPASSHGTSAHLPKAGLRRGGAGLVEGWGKGRRPGSGVQRWAVGSQSGSLGGDPFTQPLSTRVCRHDRGLVPAGSRGARATWENRARGTAHAAPLSSPLTHAPGDERSH